MEFQEYHLSEVQNTASEEKLDQVLTSMKENKVAIIGMHFPPLLSLTRSTVLSCSQRNRAVSVKRPPLGLAEIRHGLRNMSHPPPSPLGAAQESDDS